MKEIISFGGWDSSSYLATPSFVNCETKVAYFIRVSDVLVSEGFNDAQEALANLLDEKFYSRLLERYDLAFFETHQTLFGAIKSQLDLNKVEYNKYICSNSIGENGILITKDKYELLNPRKIVNPEKLDALSDQWIEEYII